ncbi:N-acetylmuramoyl-L-alanine amidase [[Clostridium] spiroforme]|nr:N-acetylmuramoyl-L-alanine amidase [Thomasclavelia spiroformis]
MKKKIILLLMIISIVLLKLQIPAYGKEKQLDHRIVVIDPGHGGFDNGAIEYGYNEDEINLQIAKKLKKQLEKNGAKVYLTRSGDYDMTKRNHHYSKQDDMYLRVKKIDSYQGHYLISIHQNASGYKSAWGSQVFYYYRSEKGKALAKVIDKHLKKVTHSQKPISGCEFRVLKATRTLGILIECGFMSNYNECGQLRNKSYQEKLCQKITAGLIAYDSQIQKQEKNKLESQYLQ